MIKSKTVSTTTEDKSKTNKTKTITVDKTGKSFNLSSINGIGSTLYSRIINRYKDESRALEAVEKGMLGLIEGISFKQACNISSSLFQQINNVSLEDTLKTKDINAIYKDLLNLIRPFTKTEYSKGYLPYFIPLPASLKEIIKKRQAYFGKSLRLLSKHKERFEINDICKEMRNLNNLNLEYKPFIKGTRLVLTDSIELMSSLEESPDGDYLEIEYLDLSERKDLSERFRNFEKDYNVILYVGENYEMLPDISNLVLIQTKENETARLFPERIIDFFAQNSVLINSLLKISRFLIALKEPEMLEPFLDKINLESLERIAKNSKLLDKEGEIVRGYSKELDDFREVAQTFINLIGETETQINDAIEKEIGGRSIEISGRKILDLYQSDFMIDNLRDYIPEEVNDFILDTIYDKLEELKPLLKLRKSEHYLINQLEPEGLEYPICLNEEGIKQLKHSVQSRTDLLHYDYLVQIAQDLRDLQNYVLELHECLLEFEFFYAIGEFCNYYNLSLPIFTEGKEGFSGVNIKNVSLLASDKVKDVEPINYQIGNVDLVIDGKNVNEKSSHINLLTGSNSGGKTQCLLSCSQAVLLAQMGFPTLGSFRIQPFEEIYYFKKSSGQISAGAFETTLLQFVNMAQSSKLKLIFADELESITEPSAASKVLAGIFSLLLENPNNYGIFVTHLVDFFKQELSDEDLNRIRIDGIEAKGLDDNLDLIVDRSPKFNFIAKSTPELILSRLSKIGDQNQKQFFKQLMKKF